MKKGIAIIMFSLALIVLGSNFRPDTAEAGPVEVFGVEQTKSCWAMRITQAGPSGVSWEYVPGTRMLCVGWDDWCFDLGFCSANLPV